MDRQFEKLDARWRLLPIGKQRRYTLYIFTGYVILAATVIITALIGSPEPGTAVAIKRIKNPVIRLQQSPVGLQDTVITPKDKNHERKFK